MLLTVTMNPSIDKQYLVERLVPNGVNRVQESDTTAGGKGINVARVAAALGESVTACGVVGGFNGQQFLSLLPPELSRDFIVTQNETRCCVNVRSACDGHHTELLESGCALSQQILEAFYERYQLQLQKCSLVTLSGSLPPGCPEDLYAKLIDMAHNAKKPVLLDTSGRWLRMGVQALPTLVKPNAEEISQMTGNTDQSLSGVLCAARRLHESGIPWVVVSMGKQGAVVVCDGGTFIATTPNVSVVNTVGCGDSMIAGFAVALMRGEDTHTCIRMGMAAATANAMNRLTGSIRIEDYIDLLPQIGIEPC